MRRLAYGLVVVLAVALARASDDPELSAIRDQLVALEIEKAQAALDAILDRPDLPESTRIEALDLRAQAHVAKDDLDAAENDYRTLLGLQAGYAPRREVTSKKAMDRFLKLQASIVGTLRLDLDPKDAAVTVDGREIMLPPDGIYPVLAGERRLHAARKGFDAQDVDVSAVAGKETLVAVRLIPNARSLVVRTDVDGVAVTLDGIDSGVTARGGESGAADGAPAVLILADVAIGEHELRLSKPCFATETVQENVSVDLADRSPKILRVVAMRPALTRVTATRALYDGELFVDHERRATLPLTSFTMCPGRRTLEVVASGRVVWSGELDAEESELALDLAPRPSAFLVGTTWPKAWDETRTTWSLTGHVDALAAVDLTTRAGWEAVAVPPGTDIAVAVIAGVGVAGVERVVLYSPTLREVEDGTSPPGPLPPRSTVATLGAVLVDGRDGSVLLATSSPAGPAASAGLLPGDRIVAIANRPVANAASASEVIAASKVGETLIFDIAPPTGPVRKVECVTTPGPRRETPSGGSSSRVVRAAWAEVNAAAGGTGAAPSLYELAILLEGAGRQTAALEIWRRVRAIGGGTLAARAAYALGAGLQADGKRVEAIEAFGQARSEGLSAGDPALAAAATDRLADLGIAPR
jgi:hypothetical protein